MGAGKWGRGVRYRLVLFFRTKSTGHAWVWMRHKMQRGAASRPLPGGIFFYGGRWPGYLEAVGPWETWLGWVCKYTRARGERGAPTLPYPGGALKSPCAVSRAKWLPRAPSTAVRSAVRLH